MVYVDEDKVSPEAELAVVGAAGSGLTLLLTEVVRRFRGKHDKRKITAEAIALEAEGDARILGAATAAFTALTERMDAEIKDLRERIRRCEGEVLELRTEREYLMRERDQLREEVKDLRQRNDLLAGEVRQLQQLASSSHRVFGQDELEGVDHGVVPA